MVLVSARPSDPSSSQLVEQFLVEVLVGLFAAHGEEDVSADELVDDLAIGGEALENDVLIVLELDHHMTRLPVDIPSLHGGVSPGLDVVAGDKLHPHDLVGRHTEQLLLLLAVKLDDEQGDSVLGQTLPGLDEVHL